MRIAHLIAFVLVLGIRANTYATPLRVALPDRENLQFLSFWVALGAGHFKDAGLEVQVVYSDTPAEVTKLLERGDAPAAVLPPPLYLTMIGDGFPLVVVANLLRHDAINLVVRESQMSARKLSAAQPLAARLAGLKGIKLGVAPGPRSRLRALFDRAGLRDDLLEVVMLMGQEQNEAFHGGKVDALYAHTPYLERALLDDGARLLVNQSSGESPYGSGQIHAFTVTQSFAAAHPHQVVAACAALARAQTLIRKDPAAAAGAVLAALPGLSPPHVKKALELYAPAVPETPSVSIAGVRGALAMFPANKVPPDLSKIDLSKHVAPRFVEQALKRRK